MKTEYPKAGDWLTFRRKDNQLSFSYFLVHKFEFDRLREQWCVTGTGWYVPDDMRYGELCLTWPITVLDDVTIEYITDPEEQALLALRFL